MMIMKFYIRKWNEVTSVLMTEMGYVLAYFSSTEEALKVCDEWYKFNDAEKKQEVTTHNLKLQVFCYEGVVSVSSDF
jgi:hypothetical protein